MKKQIILSIGVSIIIVSSFLVGFIVSTLINTPIVDTPKCYFAIDDIGLSGSNNWYDDGNKLTYNLTRVSFGSSQTGTANPRKNGFLMRFSLKDKPNNWKKCEISLYVYSVSSLRTTAQIYLFEGNWTEEEWDGYGNYMRDIEIYWKFDDYVDTNAISNSVIGFEITDITKYISNITTDTFSIAVFPRRLEYFDCSGSIYSSEWDGSDPLFPYVLPENDSYNHYLPQLIWS